MHGSHVGAWSPCGCPRWWRRASLLSFRGTQREKSSRPGRTGESLSNEPGTHGHWQAGVIADWLRTGGEVPNVHIEAWLSDLETQADRGDYVFSVNRYVTTGRPDESPTA